MEEPIDLDILLLLLSTLPPFLSPHVYHVPTPNDRPEHVSHVFECADIHAGCVCVYSIDQVSVVDVVRASQDKLIFWAFLVQLFRPFLSVINFARQLAHIILL